MRFINGIYTAQLGVTASNAELIGLYGAAIDMLPVSDQQLEQLHESLSYFLMGERTRNGVSTYWELKSFADRAAEFEAGASIALKSLSEQIRSDAEAAGVVFDAILTTTSTGSLMPGLSYRLAHQLDGLVRPDSMMIDLAHVGCTGAIKALNLVNQLERSVSNCLIVSVELPTTLINLESTDVGVWQGNCTFGDGAGAMWVSLDPGQGPTALAIADMKYYQHAKTGLDLIRWGYSNYYTFRLADEATFNQDVRSYIIQSLEDLDPGLLDSPRWVVHPAGIALLMRLSRKLGLNRRALGPTTDHYKRFSNMSSAGVLHILRDVAEAAAVGEDINLLTMGAGFNVIYGCARKER